jgi:hypothetical protein
VCDLTNKCKIQEHPVLKKRCHVADSAVPNRSIAFHFTANATAKSNYEYSYESVFINHMENHIYLVPIHENARVELRVSHRVPPQLADRETFPRYGGHRGNKIPGADPNQYHCPVVCRGICKGWRKKTSKKNHLVLQVGGGARVQLPIHGKEYKLKNLNVQTYPEGSKGKDDGEDKGIRIPNFILAPGTSLTARFEGSPSKNGKTV